MQMFALCQFVSKQNKSKQSLPVAPKSIIKTLDSVNRNNLYILLQAHELALHNTADGEE